MSRVYALYLLGAAGAYLFFRGALSTIGITGLIGVAAIAVALPAAALGGRRWIPAAALAAGLAGLLPPVETGFLALYKGTSTHSSRHLVDEGGTSVFRRWGAYGYCEILWSPPRRSFLGLYNDFLQWEYSPGRGFVERSLGAVPLWTARKGGSIAIIGAGGGRQVQYARQFGFRKVLAIEIEPAVIDAVRGPLAEAFDRVYEAPGVEVAVSEARSYMERTGETFDLIYLPSVGGYPQMMLEPGNMIRTAEAYRTMRDRLAPGGLLAIWYPAGLDPKLILTDQYVRTLRALGMDSAAWQAANRDKGKGIHEVLILASVAPAGEDPGDFPRALLADPRLTGSKEPALEFGRLLKRFFLAPPGTVAGTEGIPANPEFDPEELPVQIDPIFTPITDEKPFLAGNVQHIFSIDKVYTLFGILGGILAAAAAAIHGILRRRGDPGIPGRSYGSLALVSVLIGLNFLLAEHFLVLAIFKANFVFSDALELGAIAFLVLTGIGSALVGPRLRPVLLVAGVLSMGVLAAFHLGLPARLGLAGELPPLAGILLLAPVALVTGSFFPAVFDLAARNPLGVFAMDAVGAGVGSLLAFFLPIAFGFRTFFLVAAGVFAVTAVAVGLFLRRREVTTAA